MDLARRFPLSNCDTCFHCTEYERSEDETIMLCERFPPSLTEGIQEYPIVSEDHRCGEYLPDDKQMLMTLLGTCRQREEALDVLLGKALRDPDRRARARIITSLEQWLERLRARQEN